jgi:hypothetical protein
MLSKGKGMATIVHLDLERRSCVVLGAALRCRTLVQPCRAVAPSDGTGWKPPFNSNDLDGWGYPYDWGKARVEDRRIVAQADKRSFPTTEKKYCEVVSEGEVKMPERQTNSGLMFRCHHEHNKA